jgi:hypothetical protein
MPTLVKWFILAIGLILVAMIVATKILKSKIQNKIDAQGIVVENFKLNLITRSATLKNISYHKDRDSIHIDQLTVSSIRIVKLLTQNKIELGEVLITNPVIIVTDTLRQNLRQNKNSSSSDIEEILIHTFSISRLNLTLTGKSQLIAMADVDLKDLLITRENQTPSFQSGNALVENFTYTPKDSLHTIHVRSLAANSLTDSIVVDSISVVSNYSKETFGKKAGFQKDRFEITIPSILISGFAGSSLKDSVLSISRIEILSPDLSVFRDKRQPFNEKQRKDLPGDLLSQMSIALAIDSILLKDSKIVYEEYPEGSEKTIEIIFTDLQASLNGLNTTKGNEQKYATLVASSTFMNSGAIDAKFQIPLLPKLAHTASGTITNLPLRSLNPILTTLGRVSIENGSLQQLNFSFWYDRYQAKGDLEMRYKDFKLKVSNASNPRAKDETLSALINLVINNNKVETKTGLIDIERDPKRFVFNTWWKALSNGIKNSINPLKSDKKKRK